MKTHSNFSDLVGIHAAQLRVAHLLSRFGPFATDFKCPHVQGTADSRPRRVQARSLAVGHCRMLRE